MIWETTSETMYLSNILEPFAPTRVKNYTHARGHDGFIGKCSGCELTGTVHLLDYKRQSFLQVFKENVEN